MSGLNLGLKLRLLYIDRVGVFEYHRNSLRYFFDRLDNLFECISNDTGGIVLISFLRGLFWSFEMNVCLVLPPHSFYLLIMPLLRDIIFIPFHFANLESLELVGSYFNPFSPFISTTFRRTDELPFILLSIRKLDD